MFKIAVIVFRESLEIALLLGVIMAVTKPIINSRVYIILGILIGVVSAAIFAFFTRKIAKSFGGEGDELVDSCIILLTAAVISWTVVWMQGYNHKIKKDLSRLSESINAGLASRLTLVLAVASTILREGAEIILLIYGLLPTGNHINGTEYLTGIGIGAFSGLAVGVTIYFGLMRLTGKYVFKICTVLLTLIAAGLSAEAAGRLTSSGFIVGFSGTVWDSSWLISNYSTIGKILHVTLGYHSKPNVMQVIFYFLTVIVTFILMKLRSNVAYKRHA